jgi:hypothetical protein
VGREVTEKEEKRNRGEQEKRLQADEVGREVIVKENKRKREEKRKRRTTERKRRTTEKKTSQDKGRRENILHEDHKQQLLLLYFLVQDRHFHLLC